jgi:hypothetical protein
MAMAHSMVPYRKEFDAGDLQTMQTYEDKISEATMAIDSNIEVISALRGYYEELLREVNFPLRTTSQRAVLNFTKHLKNACYDLKLQSSRARLLRQQAAGRKELVSRNGRLT